MANFTLEFTTDLALCETAQQTLFDRWLKANAAYTEARKTGIHEASTRFYFECLDQQLAELNQVIDRLIREDRERQAAQDAPEPEEPGTFRIWRKRPHDGAFIRLDAVYSSMQEALDVMQAMATQRPKGWEFQVRDAEGQERVELTT